VYACHRPESSWGFGYYKLRNFMLPPFQKNKAYNLVKTLTKHIEEKISVSPILDKHMIKVYLF
jgi:hypothetical protein